MSINNKSYTFILLILTPLLLGLFACQEKGEKDVFFTGDEYKNIMQFIDENPEYSDFASIIDAGKMRDVLSSYNNNGGGAYTLYLPDNDAVQAFIDERIANGDIFDSLEKILENSKYSRELVMYHIVNAEIFSTDFPNGVLPDRTLSDNFLTVVFRENGDTVEFAINDKSKVEVADISLSNGVAHTIDIMLQPIVLTGYQTLAIDPNFSIFSKLLTEAGLVDTLNYFIVDETGREIYNEYTLFAESNSLYAANKINSFDDLVKMIAPEDNDYTDPENAVNIFARYHILTESYFLDEFYTSVYNTYTKFPVSVDLDQDIWFNLGVNDTIIDGNDTTVVEYLQARQEVSNILSKSGAIHQLDYILSPFKPGLKAVSFECYEEPLINQVKAFPGTYYFDDEDLFFIELLGATTIKYVNSETDIPMHQHGEDRDKDYIEFNTDAFSYTLPNVLPGRYNLILVLHRGERGSANIQSYFDDKKVGDILDLSTATNGSKFYYTTLGTVSIDDYKSHTLSLKSISSGRIRLARVLLQPK